MPSFIGTLQDPSRFNIGVRSKIWKTSHATHRTRILVRGRNSIKLRHNDGVVGIWHETYLMEPNKFEVFYGNMPKFGLGAAMEHIEATGHRQTARKQLEANQAPDYSQA